VPPELEEEEEEEATENMMRRWGCSPRGERGPGTTRSDDHAKCREVGCPALIHAAHLDLPRRNLVILETHRRRFRGLKAKGGV